MTRSIILLFFFLFGFLTACTDIDFDTEKWKSWNINESETNLRWDMANDLIENYHLKGKTKQEILELLGDPIGGLDPSSDVFSYDLGPCRRGIDFGGLYITFKKGKVTKIEKTCN